MKLPKFLIVGSLGTVTNLVLFYVLVDILRFPALPVPVFTFLVASIQNYLLNHNWTFADTTSQSPANFSYYIRFVSVAIVGLGINVAILWLVLNVFNPPLKVIAQAVGIASGTAFNFLGSKHWVFK